MTPTETDARLSHLPAKIRRHLDDLTASLQRALGDDLSALLVFGSAARGGYIEGQSDIDALLILRDAAPHKLAEISAALVLARYAARIEALILTAAEIPRAADVFPLLYDDIRGCHVLLAGQDLLIGLHISDRHRRLRIEQELREAQIRLRRAVIEARGVAGELTGAIRRKLRQIRGPLHALLKLRRVECGDSLGPVLDAAGRLYALDLAPLSASGGAPGPALAALSALLHAAVCDVDQMADPGDER